MKTGLKSETVTLGSVQIKVTQLPGEDAAILGLRVASLFGVAGLTMIEEVFAAKGSGLTTAVVRSALEGLVLTIQRANPAEVRAIFRELATCMRQQMGTIVSTEALNFSAAFENEPERVWFYYELFVRAVGLNYADFFPKAVGFMGSLQSRLEAQKTPEQPSENPISSQAH